MTADQKLNEASRAVDSARKARSLAVTEEDRDRTWTDLSMAIANYNQCLREVAPLPVSAGSGA